MDCISMISKYKQNEYQIKFTSGEQWTVSEDFLVKNQLYKGKELSLEEVNSLKQFTQLDRGYQLSLHYLSYQLRTTKEIRDYLKKKEIDSVYHKTIIQKLIDLHLIDDLEYAKSYVRTMMRTSDKGPIVLGQKLKTKGITDYDIQESLSLFDEESQLQVAIKTAQKLVNKYRTKNFHETKQKIYLSLQTKGFSTSIIQEAMMELQLEKDHNQEYELLVKQGDKIWRKHQKLSFSERKMKVKQNLFQKGYDYDLIQQYITEKEQSGDEESV